MDMRRRQVGCVLSDPKEKKMIKKNEVVVLLGIFFLTAGLGMHGICINM